jgi:hypothetical protein
MTYDALVNAIETFIATPIDLSAPVSQLESQYDALMDFDVHLTDFDSCMDNRDDEIRHDLLHDRIDERAVTLSNFLCGVLG